MIVLILQLAITIVYIAGMWKAFEKAGHPGWAAIVPFYNIYILTVIAKKPAWWLVLCLIPLVNIVILILMSIEIAKEFGKESGFGVGLGLLPFIFWPILGFGDATYQGRVAANDEILDAEDIIDQSGGQNQEVPQAVKTLSILSIIGSSFWSLFWLIGMFWMIGAVSNYLSAASTMGSMLPIADPSGAVLVLVIVFLILIGMNVGTLIAAVRMMQGKKAFILYAICNGLWSLLCLMTLGNQADPTIPALTGLAGIGFIIGFGVQMKNMPN